MKFLPRELVRPHMMPLSIKYYNPIEVDQIIETYQKMKELESQPDSNTFKKEFFKVSLGLTSIFGTVLIGRTSILSSFNERKPVMGAFYLMTVGMAVYSLSSVVLTAFEEMLSINLDHTERQKMLSALQLQLEDAIEKANSSKPLIYIPDWSSMEDDIRDLIGGVVDPV